MIKEYASKANIGIGIGIVGNLLLRFAVIPQINAAGGASGGTVALIGVASLGFVALTIWGCCMYMKAKAQPWAWGFLGLLSIIGLIILVCFKDKAKDGIAPTARGFDVMPPQR